LRDERRQTDRQAILFSFTDCAVVARKIVHIFLHQTVLVKLPIYKTS